MGFGKSFKQIKRFGKSSINEIGKGFKKAEKFSGKVLSKADGVLKIGGDILDKASPGLAAMANTIMPGSGAQVDRYVSKAGRMIHNAGEKIDNANYRRSELINQKKEIQKGFKDAYNNGAPK